MHKVLLPLFLHSHIFLSLVLISFFALLCAPSANSLRAVHFPPDLGHALVRWHTTIPLFSLLQSILPAFSWKYIMRNYLEITCKTRNWIIYKFTRSCSTGHWHHTYSDCDSSLKSIHKSPHTLLYPHPCLPFHTTKWIYLTFPAYTNLWIIYVYINKSKNIQLNHITSIIHDPLLKGFHLSARFSRERHLLLHYMSDCHAWTKTQCNKDRTHPAACLMSCLCDGPLLPRSLCACFSDVKGTITP